VITAHGTQSLEQSRERLAEAEQELLGALSNTERSAFRDLLGRVARSGQPDPGVCLAAEEPTDESC